jgi:hypothetical protein
LGELIAVRVPDEFEEQTRDLVRAREDARADLMRVRHRLSKLLLRHGLMWERRAWTGEHDRWLRGMRFEGPLAVCFDECYGAVLQAKARRDRLDEAIGDVASTPAYVETVARLRCLRGVSTLTALALTVELGDWRRFEPASLGAFLGLVPSESSSGERRRQGRSRRRATATPGGCWSKPPGTSADHCARASRSAAAGRANQRPSVPKPKRSPEGCTGAGSTSSGAANDARSPRSRSRANSRGTAGSWRRCRNASREDEGEESAPATHARSDSRRYYEQPTRRCSTLDGVTAPDRTTGHAVPTPHISLTDASTTADALSPPTKKARTRRPPPSAT